MTAPAASLIYGSTKTYVHSQGLSCAFRQWRADSHCSKIHGYALQVRIEFEAIQLDKNNWVMDFGSLKEIKEFLEFTFDHTLIVAQDDPFLKSFESMHASGIADIRYLESTGCEFFAQYIFEAVEDWLKPKGDRVRLMKVEISEHEGNSAYARRRNSHDWCTFTA